MPSSENQRARFVLEAEITGNLEHPGIVPVYSLGRNADGRPYYAMRFIRGDSRADGSLAASTPSVDPGGGCCAVGISVAATIAAVVVLRRQLSNTCFRVGEITQEINSRVDAIEAFH